jgi:Spondin_N.
LRRTRSDAGGNDVTYPGHSPGASASDGIERIAEDGRPAGASNVPGNHVAELGDLTGVTVPLSPGGYAAHSDQIQLFNTGESASDGVERIAEDGNPTTLVTNLQGNTEITDGGAFAIPDGASEDGPLAPTPPDAENNSYTVTVDASQGDRLSIGTMYIQSNDVFYAFQPEGISLFSDGSPISGDQTGKLRLYDAGTEVDEEPGVGLNQAPRQPDADTGEDENGNVVRIEDSNGDGFPENDGFSYAPILDGDGNPTIIKVTVTPQ